MKVLHKVSNLFPHKLDFEVVERKGIGHPDTVADALAERISVEYSKYCLEHFGIVLHHNVDKVGVMGGLLDIDWGKAQLVKPIRVMLNGRISRSFNGKQIPVFAIAQKAIKKQLKKSLPSLDVDKDVVIIDESTNYSRNPVWFNPRNKNDVPDHKNPKANDTSVVVSYWPLTEVEEGVKQIEGFFYHKDGTPKFADIGQDIKVMIIREMNNLDITVSMPFFARFLKQKSDYFERLEEVNKELQPFVAKLFPSAGKINLKLTPLNDLRHNLSKSSARSFYLVATGGALDYGEEGFVGRGNNRLGVIPSMRPYSMEAAAGKNPVYHVGKVLGVAADCLAKTIAETFDTWTEVLIVTRNGDPLLEPNRVIVKTEKEIDKNDVRRVTETVLKAKNWTDYILNKEILIPAPGGRR